jgi:hypothetical protein
VWRVLLFFAALAFIRSLLLLSLWCDQGVAMATVAEMQQKLSVIEKEREEVDKRILAHRRPPPR